MVFEPRLIVSCYQKCHCQCGSKTVPSLQAEVGGSGLLLSKDFCGLMQGPGPLGQTVFFLPVCPLVHGCPRVFHPSFLH